MNIKKITNKNNLNELCAHRRAEKQDSIQLNRISKKAQPFFAFNVF